MSDDHPALHGPEFYDEDAVFNVYMQARQRAENANDTLEKPLLLAMLGDPQGKHILDLGCGDAAFGLELLSAGAGSYTGVEGSTRMAARAREVLAGSAGVVIQSNLESWDYPPGQFDVVVSRLVFHYLPDLSPVFARIHQTLKPGGRLVFSVEHPVITSCDRARPPGTIRQDWIVDNYFDTGPRETQWLGGQVVKYHRTIEDHFSALQNAGLRVEQLRESRPERANFASEATYERRKRIPLFLLMAAEVWSAPAK